MTRKNFTKKIAMNPKSPFPLRKSLLLFFVVFMITISGSGCIAGAMFRRIVLVPDEPALEFKNSNRSPSSVTPRLLSGEYLGVENVGKKEFHHYQFDGILDGERTLHIFISADGYGDARAWEEEKAFSSQAAPAALIFPVHPNYPDNFSRLRTPLTPSQNDKKYAPVLCAMTMSRDNTIGIFLPEDANEKGIGEKMWQGPLSVARKKRSKIMPWIRPFYALPISIVCIPVDCAMCIYTPFEFIFSPRRMEAMTYPAWIEALKNN